MSLDNSNAEYVNEIGYELLLQGKNKEAMKCYQNAMKLDESSVAALTGKYCYFVASNGEISKQSDFSRSNWSVISLQSTVINPFLFIP